MFKYGGESSKDRLKRLRDKAETFREENTDIPKLAEICIYFGIKREELKRDLKKLLDLK